MQLKSILNRVQLHRGFVYGAIHCRNLGKQMILEVEIRPRKRIRPICSGCGRFRPGYDVLRGRRFEFVPLWGIPVFFLYAMRRVSCPRCGVKVERVPWAEGKNHLTTTYAWFLARWAKRLSWKEVAVAFQTTWDNVHRSVKMAVTWGLAHRGLEGVTSIGIDEIAWKKGHKYLTLVYQIDAGCKRLLWVGRERTQKTLRQFFKEFGKERTGQLRFICSDMWKPYLRTVGEVAGQAIHIIDRFHVMGYFGKAIDKIRATEARELRAKGEEPILTGSRWCLLKRPENLTDKQVVKLKDLLAANLKTIRAYLLKEDSQRFWRYKSPAWASKFLDDWCERTTRSRLKPMKKVAKMLRTHRKPLLNWFRCRGQVALGAVEGFNNKAKVTTRKAYGFRSFDILKIALYHTLGDLPEPEVTHKFC
ncbi:MAG: ISL3 family transposase [Deltaproteobacteria bacterium]|jgi:transposase